MTKWISGFSEVQARFHIHLRVDGKLGLKKLVIMQSEWDFSGNLACGMCPVGTDSYWVNPGKWGKAAWMKSRWIRLA